MIRPVLDYLSDGKWHANREIQNHISSIGSPYSRLSDATRKNWVAFALKNLQRAEAIIRGDSHEYRINQRGLELQKQGHEHITVDILKQYPEMRQSLHIAAIKAAATRQA